MTEEIKTVYVQVKGYLEWAKVFPFNREMPEDATDKKVRKGLEACEGMYKVNFYPDTQEDKQKLLDAGMTEDLYNSDKPRFQKGSDYGIGEFVILKRKHKDEKETKKGIVNFGGPPPVVWFLPEDNYPAFNTELEGLIGNGTKAMVKISIYGTDTSQTIRLEKVGIIDLNRYGNTGGTGATGW